MHFCADCKAEIVRLTQANIDLRVLVSNLKAELSKYRVEPKEKPAQTLKAKKAMWVYRTMFKL